ncbi:MAG: hypothetical protein ABSB82_15990 [Terriglobia bacterium]
MPSVATHTLWTCLANAKETSKWLSSGSSRDLDIAPISGSVVLSAIKQYEKLTQREQGEQVEGLTPKELFDGMSKDEREAFARDGS